MPAMELVRTISLHTDDFSELEQALTGWDQEYFQLSPGTFDGGIEMVQVGATQIMLEHWGRKIWCRGTTPPGAYGFALAMETTGATDWMGRKADGNTVIVQAPGREADLVSPDHWDALVISVAEEDVLALLAALSSDDDLSGGLHGTITLQKEAADRLRRRGREFLRESMSPSGCREGHVASHAAQFVKEFIWEMIKAKEMSRFFADPLRHAAIVRHATDLSTAHGPGHTGLVDICAQLGISLRTLHYAFQDVTGVSPATWMRRTRLNLVHRALKTASPADVSIRDIAKQSGFLHYGHFSEQYRRLFGLSPMQTLKSN